MTYITKNIIGKVKDYIKNSDDVFSKTYDQKKQLGYVTRKVSHEEFLNRNVYEASGKRKGEYFYLSPSFNSSRYCYRIYIHIDL